MVERPIIFSGPMVQAILAGRKTQTRRVVKPQPDVVQGAVCFLDGDSQLSPVRRDRVIRCPYGQPGDHLWVRESFRLRADQDDKPPSRDWWKTGASWFEADGRGEPSGCGGGYGKLRPAIHMPRWASRLTLEVTGIRVQRVRDITDEDVMAEGIRLFRAEFAGLWDAINAARGFGWEKNPWVWVVAFRRAA